MEGERILTWGLVFLVLCHNLGCLWFLVGELVEGGFERLPMDSNEQVSIIVAPWRKHDVIDIGAILSLSKVEVLAVEEEVGVVEEFRK